jgi:hypothetical protein
VATFRVKRVWCLLIFSHRLHCDVKLYVPFCTTIHDRRRAAPEASSVYLTAPQCGQIDGCTGAFGSGTRPQVAAHTRAPFRRTRCQNLCWGCAKPKTPARLSKVFRILFIADMTKIIWQCNIFCPPYTGASTFRCLERRCPHLQS